MSPLLIGISTVLMDNINGSSGAVVSRCPKGNLDDLRARAPGEHCHSLNPVAFGPVA